MSGYYRKQRAEKKAVALLKQKFKDYCLDSLFLDLTSDIDAVYFKYLFDLGDDEIKMALWNNLVYSSNLNSICKKKYTEEEYEFIKDAHKAWKTRDCIDEENINDPIKTERLILCPYTKSDKKLIISQIQKDSDPEDILHCPFSVDKYKHKFGYAGFLIFSIKEIISQKTIGMIMFDGYPNWAINQNEDLHKVWLHYYIFKDFRGNGYAYEASKALITELFNGNLKHWAPTKFEFKYKESYIKDVDIVAAQTNENNAVSRAILEKLGFTYTGIFYRVSKLTKDTYRNDAFYYLEKQTPQTKRRA